MCVCVYIYIYIYAVSRNAVLSFFILQVNASGKGAYEFKVLSEMFQDFEVVCLSNLQLV